MFKILSARFIDFLARDNVVQQHRLVEQLEASLTEARNGVAFRERQADLAARALEQARLNNRFVKPC